MSAVDGGGNNYMSDSAILAWVTIQQSRQYGQLEDAMTDENLRGEMTSDLANIKKEMNKATKDASVYPQLNDDIKAFQEKYGPIPEFNDVVASLDDLAGKVSANVDAQSTYEADLAAYNALPVPMGDDEDTRGAPPTPPGLLNKDDVKDWADSVDKIVDQTNQNEQLGMIRINEIKSTIDHAGEMASQLIKSDNDTTAFMIHNFT